MRELLEEIDLGTRTIAGTDWPVVDQLWRTGERSWEIVRELCNGAPRSTEPYRSEAAAREAFERRLDGRKPRAGKAAGGKTIGVRCTEEERARWEEAAAREGLKLSDWIRAAAELAIARGSTR